MGLNDFLSKASTTIASGFSEAGQMADRIATSTLEATHSEVLLGILKDNVEKAKKIDHLKEYPVHHAIADMLDGIKAPDGIGMYNEIVSNDKLFALLMSLSDLNDAASKIETNNSDIILTIAPIHALIENIKELQYGLTSGSMIVINGGNREMVGEGEFLNSDIHLLDGIRYHRGDDSGYHVADMVSVTGVGASPAELESAVGSAESGSTDLTA